MRFNPCPKGSKRPPFSKEWKQNISNGQKGILKTEEVKRKISIGRKGKCLGENNPAYIKDRTLLKKSEKKCLDVQYIYWVKKVRTRDNNKCKINNSDCEGRLETHHILPWRDYPKLRYEINNGITLCHAHHPHRYAEEKRLTPYFKELVSVSKE